MEKCILKAHKMSVVLTWHAPPPHEVGDSKWELRGQVFREIPSTIPKMVHEEIEFRKHTRIGS